MARFRQITLTGHKHTGDSLPGKPIFPSSPLGPFKPSCPSNPEYPGAPFDPFSPKGPAGPVFPCLPRSPTLPSSPLMPLNYQKLRNRRLIFLTSAIKNQCSYLSDQLFRHGPALLSIQDTLVHLLIRRIPSDLLDL